MATAPEGLAALKIDRTRRRARSAALPWIIGIVAVLIVAFIAPQVYVKVRGVEVSVSPVTAAMAGSGMLSATGYIVADRQSVLAFKGTGRLIKLNVVESQPVKKDEEIAEIDHTELDATIEQAKALHAEAEAEAERMKIAVAQAEADLAMSKAPLATTDAQTAELKIRLSDAKRRLERDKLVSEKNAMPYSEVEDRMTEVSLAQAAVVVIEQRRLENLRRVESGEAALNTARGAVAVAERRVKTAAAYVEVLRAQRLDAFVYSPFDGVVTEKAAELGEIVAPISIGGSMARGSIATIAEWASLQAEVDVAEAYIAQVKAGQRATITVDAFPDKTFAGKVRRILPHANRSKATVQVRVDFVDHSEAVLPDMGIRVKFIPDDAPASAEAQAKSNAQSIPKSALQGTPDARFVWVITDSLAHKRAIVVNKSSVPSEAAEVASGLSLGEAVVTRGAEKLVEENQKVRVAE